MCSLHSANHLPLNNLSALLNHRTTDIDLISFKQKIHYLSRATEMPYYGMLQVHTCTFQLLCSVNSQAEQLKVVTSHHIITGVILKVAFNDGDIGCVGPGSGGHLQTVWKAPLACRVTWEPCSHDFQHEENIHCRAEGIQQFTDV